jgi:hypothetical protein
VCGAGADFFVMDIEGNVRRCSTLTRSYGNLFQGTAQLDGKPEVCPSRVCNCPYEGIRGLSGVRGTIRSVSKEMLDEYTNYIKTRMRMRPAVIKRKLRKLIAERWG